MMRGLRWGALAGAVLVAACATPPPADDAEAVAEYEATNDPLEPLNRGIFDFNRFFDRILLRPLAEAYVWLFPVELRDAVHNMLSNSGEPVNLVNATLQGNGERAGTALGRVLINTTLGVGGIIDVATDLGLPPVDEDFGQTLAVWGSGEGPYLILPLLGPSTVRDGVGRGVDIFFDPVTYVLANTDKEYLGPAIIGTKGIDLRARSLERLDEIERTSVDYYAAIRSLYRQHRDNLISNGEEPPFLYY